MGMKYLISDTELTNIANAIREKSHATDKMSVADMPDKIAQLQSEEILSASGYKKKDSQGRYYIYDSALDIVNKVNNVRKPDSIVFIAMSDSHYPASQSNTTAYTANKKSSVQANQVVKALTYMLDIDFFTHLGDVGTGAAATTPEMLQEQTAEFMSFFTEANSDLPLFIAIGNHDNGIYYHNGLQTLISDYNSLVAEGEISEANTKASTLIDRCPDVIDLGIVDGLRKFDTSKMRQSYCFSGQFMYDNFTAYSASTDTVMGDQTYGGYCYRDFISKKLRVFLLNTSEQSIVTSAEVVGLTGNQKKWFADALVDLNTTKPDWSFIVLSHIPADYSGNMPLSELLQAYVAGGSITIVPETGTSKTYDFNNKNTAQFAAQFHGHIHNFKTSRLHTKSNGTVTQYDAHRICVSNVQFDRENSYADVGGIDFSDSLVYAKSADSRTGTSFVVNVVTPSEKKIYSFCVGAGFDRTIAYGKGTYYNVIFTSETGTMFNQSMADSVLEETSYTTTLTTASGLKLSTADVTVLMGGVDITAQCYNVETGEINIESVTGDITITADAHDRAFFAVSYDLVNVTGDNEAIEVPNESTATYKITLQPIDNLVIKNVSVYMGGEDVSARYMVNNNGIYTINITNITGDIRVSANAPVSNLWLMAQSPNNSSIFQNVGYVNNYRYVGSGSGNAPFDDSISNNATAEGHVVTGLIPYYYDGAYQLPPTLEIKGVDIDTTSSYTRITVFSSTKAFRSTISPNTTNSLESAYELETIGTRHYLLKPRANDWGYWAGCNGRDTAWIRFSLPNAQGDNLVIRPYNQATPSIYTVTLDIGKLYSTNRAQAAYGGYSYSAYISDTAYLSMNGAPTVKMGGIDVTATALADDLRTIFIANVTGDITITANSIPSENNALKTSVDVDNTTYNVVGYKSNTYLSGANVGTRNGIYASGFIEVKWGDTIYFKNCTMRVGNSDHRICSYDGEKGFIKENRFSNDILKNIGAYTEDENGNLASIKVDGPQWQTAGYLRFCCSYIGPDSIVTVNKPIE